MKSFEIIRRTLIIFFDVTVLCVICSFNIVKEKVNHE